MRRTATLLLLFFAVGFTGVPQMGATLEGVVLLGVADPVSGLVVTLNTTGDRENEWTVIDQDITDDRGRYEFRGAPCGMDLTIEVYWDKDLVYRQTAGEIEERRRLAPILLVPLRTEPAVLELRDIVEGARERGLNYPVRSIRGDQPSRQSYQLFPHNGDDAVVDLDTGLMWQRRGSDDLPWQAEARPDAQAYLAGLNSTPFAGFDDWRFPTVEELLSLMLAREARTQRRATLYIDPVFEPEVSAVWSIDEGSRGSQFRASFSLGGVDSGSTATVLAVRTLRLTDELPNP